MTRVVAILVAQYAAMVWVLFGTAGTACWVAGWVFLLLFAATATPASLSIARHDPDLARERMRLFSSGQPFWDRAVMLALVLLIGGWMVVPGLDAVRYRLSMMPLGLRCVGAVFMVLSIIAGYAVMRQNTFLAPSVRLQADRAHRVVDTGAYAVVRHPFYAALLPFFPSAALLLGSWYAVLLSGAITLLLAYRAVREERFLMLNLPGYSAYMQRVPHRLLPYVW